MQSKNKYFIRLTSKGTVYVKNDIIMFTKEVLRELVAGDKAKLKVKELRNEAKNKQG